MGLLQKVWSVIVSVFSGLFGELKKLYKDLPEDQRQALVSGSEMMAFLNTVLDKAPSEVIEGLIKQFPKLTDVQISTSIEAICKLVRLPFTDLKGGITELQGYISGLPDKASWSKFMNLGASVITTMLNPGTPQQKITLLLEFVYQQFVKPLFVKKA